MDVPSGGVILEREPCHGPSTGIMISGISSTGSATSSTLKTFGPPKIFIGFAFVQLLSKHFVGYGCPGPSLHYTTRYDIANRYSASGKHFSASCHKLSLA